MEQLRSYGRRKGHRLSPYRERLFEELLPNVLVDIEAPNEGAPMSLFREPCDDVWLEIGFGNGEHLVAQAESRPDIGFIGAEPFLNGVSTVLAELDKKKLPNIRLYHDDVRPLLDWLPANTIGRVFILFPDPWPKKRHHKRRLVASPLLDQLARVMRDGAILRVASDIGDYVRTALLAVNAHQNFQWIDEGPSDWRSRNDDWPPTRYEQKAVKAGRRCAYMTFQYRGAE